MNKLVLFKMLIAAKRLERVPVILLAGGWVGRFSGIQREQLYREAHALVKAHVMAYETLDQDAILCYFDPLFIPEAYGCKVRFISSGPIADPIEFDVSTSVELKQPSLNEGRLPVILEAVGRLSAYGKDQVPVGTLFEGPFTTLSRIIGTERLMRLTIKGEETVKKFMDQVTAFLISYEKALKDTGADLLVIADPASSPSLISPRTYHRLVLPCMKRLVAGLCMPVILHVCGDTSLILPLLVETGASVISLDQCMDMEKARELVGDRCALGGNLDPVGLLLMGTAEQVAAEAERCLRLGGKKNFVLMPGCGIPPGAPLENLAAMIRAARQV